MDIGIPGGNCEEWCECAAPYARWWCGISDDFKNPDMSASVVFNAIPKILSRSKNEKEKLKIKTTKFNLFCELNGPTF